MNIHNDINNDIKFLAKSEIRLKILNELYKKPNTVRGLVKKTKITYSSVSNNVLKLEEHNYIKKIKSKYHVNPMSEVYLKTLMDFKTSLDMVSDYKSFWNRHDLNQLSINSVRRITDLKDSQLVETTPVDIYKTHNTIKNQIMESQNVKAVFPYLHPEYPELIEGILKNKGSVELIIPQIIFKDLMFHINVKIRKNAIKRHKLHVYLTKNKLNLYLTICDDTMSLGLFKNDGSFDQNRILISDKTDAINWADELFNHVKHQVIK